MSAEDSTTAEAPNVRRLTELDVREVSLVDRAAIDRTFLVTKRHTDSSNGDTDMSDLTSAHKNVLAKSAPIVRAIAVERLDMVKAALDKLSSPETMTKQEVRDELSAVFSNLWAADSDLTALAKSLQGEGLLPGDFDFEKARGFKPGDADEAESAEADTAKGDSETAETTKSETAETTKSEPDAIIADDLVAAIDVVCPLLAKASEQEAAPSAELDRVSAFLGKVSATKGMVSKGLTADNVEKSFGVLTGEGYTALTNAHDALGNFLSVAATGNETATTKTDGDPTNTTKCAEGEDSGIAALIKSFEAKIDTKLGTLNDRLTTFETARKSASAADEDGGTGAGEALKKSVDWSGVIK